MTDLADTLDDVVAYLNRYVWFDSEEKYNTVSLWTAATHIVEDLDVIGMLWLTSPTRECGKSLVLDILEHLVHEPLKAVSASMSSMFRSVEEDHCTVLLDEVDTSIFNSNTDDEKVAFLNSCYRRGQYVTRTAGIGNNLHPVKFETFAAVALGGIGDIPHQSCRDVSRSRCNAYPEATNANDSDTGRQNSTPTPSMPPCGPPCSTTAMTSLEPSGTTVPSRQTKSDHGKPTCGKSSSPSAKPQGTDGDDGQGKPP